MFEHFIYAVDAVFSLKNLLLMSIGTIVGMGFGATPGLTVTLGVVMVLPFTFSLSPESAILILTGVYCAGTYAGSISAILINTPGTPSSVATCWDGYQLTKQGKSYEALSIALNSSVLGGLMSAISLLFFAPYIAKFALRFGPPEKFALVFFGLTIISRVSGKDIKKGLLAAFFGLLVSTVGMDPMTGLPRFTFNIMFLYGGIGMIEVFIGLYAIAEIFNQISKDTKRIELPKDSVKRKIFSWLNIVPYFKTVVKSSVIGIIVGAIPGTGGSIASFIAYDEAKRSSKNPGSFGKGNPEGVAAAESANNGVTAATLIPTLTLGIPGNAVSAIYLGALLVHGLTPGPQLFVRQADLMYTIIFGFFIANIIMYLQGLVAINWFQKIVAIPRSILLPTLLVMCLVGSYALSNSLYSIVISLIFGCIGYAMIRFKYPTAPMVIAIILGPMAETSLRQSLLLSDGSFTIFFSRPISLFFILLILFAGFWPTISKKILKKKK